MFTKIYFANLVENHSIGYLTRCTWVWGVAFSLTIADFLFLKLP